MELDQFIELDASQSMSRDGQLLTYKWQCIEKMPGAQIEISSPGEVRTQVKISKSGSYRLMLTVKTPDDKVSYSQVKINGGCAFAIPTGAAVRWEVETLTDRGWNAGRHSLMWNPDDLSSGVYFIKMIACDQCKIIKCVHSR